MQRIFHPVLIEDFTSDRSTIMVCKKEFEATLTKINLSKSLLTISDLTNHVKRA